MIGAADVQLAFVHNHMNRCFHSVALPNKFAGAVVDLYRARGLVYDV